MNQSHYLLFSLALAATLGCGDASADGRGVPCDPDAVTPLPTSVFVRLGLRRGINLGNRLDAPEEGAWGPVTRESDFATIAARGFDHVRLPVRFGAHALPESPFTLETEFMARVDWAIERALEQGLTVVLDFHYYDELMSEPEAHRERFAALWEQLAERYQDLPERVVFELLSDPRDALTGIYEELVQETVLRIRSTNPERLLIVDSPDSSGAGALAELDLPEDENLVASAHLFVPELFTLQGVTWLTPEYLTTGVVFPGPPATPLVPVAAAQESVASRLWFEQYNSLPPETNPSGPAAIRAAMLKLVEFRAETGRDVYVGQFGASLYADLDSRVRFLTMLRQGLEAEGLGWAVWDNNGSEFAVLGRAEGSWLDATVEALIPSGGY